MGLEMGTEKPIWKTILINFHPTFAVNVGSINVLKVLYVLLILGLSILTKTILGVNPPSKTSLDEPIQG